MALKLAEEQAVREEEEAKEEEASNPMKLLENRTKQSKNEIELLESLEELKDLNRRQEAVDYDSMLLSYDTSISEREREERMQQMDEEYIKYLLKILIYLFLFFLILERLNFKMLPNEN